MVEFGPLTLKEKRWAVIKKIADKSEKRILAQKIVEIENALGITGKELSRLSGVSDATIYRIEGRVESNAGVSEKILIKIAEAVGVDPDWLMDTASDASAGTSDPVDTEKIVWAKDDQRKDLASDENAAMVNDKSSDGSSDENEKQGVAAVESPGERIRSLRIGLSLTQEHFAKSLDITQGYLAMIESGKAKLSEQVAAKIEEIYEDAGAEWLLTGNDRNRVCPIGDNMIEWLKNHQRAREKIRIWMDEEEIGRDDA